MQIGALHVAASTHRVTLRALGNEDFVALGGAEAANKELIGVVTGAQRQQRDGVLGCEARLGTVQTTS